MCNLYSETKGQAAIRALFRTVHDRTGNLPAFPGIFPDQPAPIVRNSAGGERELVMARWGMPGPPQFGGQPVTNIRNVASPHWRGWLARNRCLVPATSFRGDRGAMHLMAGLINKLIDVKSRWAMPTIGQSLSRSSRRQPETASGRGASQIGRPERSRPSAPKCAPRCWSVRFRP